MSDSVFTKIINGEIPAHFIVKEKDFVAFLDIHPIRPGHTLVVPKKQVGSYLEMDGSDFKDLMDVSRKIAKPRPKIELKSPNTLENARDLD